MSVVGEISSKHWDNGLMHSSTAFPISIKPQDKYIAQFYLRRISKPTTHGTLSWAKMWNLKTLGPFLNQLHESKHKPLNWSVVLFIADAWISNASKVSEWLELLNLLKTPARITLIAAPEYIRAGIRLSAIIILQRSDCMPNIHLFSAMRSLKIEKILSETTMAIAAIG